MKCIELTQGKLAIVDDSDYPSISLRKWYVAKTGRGYFYAVREQARKRIYMHREIAGDSGAVIDHINGDTLDNRRENIRCVSIAENVQNITKPVRSSTGERYVFSVRNVFMVRIVRFGKRYYGGCFPTVIAASIGRDALMARLEAENIDLKARAAA